MLPPILGSLIKNRKDEFNPSATHPLYESYKDTWRLYLDLFELDEIKLQNLIISHTSPSDKEQEDPGMLQLRKRLASVFNYVPTIIRMTTNYLFSEQPVLSSTDPEIAAFIADCDGIGTTFEDYIRNSALPLALIFGFVDVLVQNPSMPDGLFVSAADDAALGEIAPRAHSITPLQRINWSNDSAHGYNWICFTDTTGDDTDPFKRNVTMPIEYLTISKAIFDGSGVPVKDETKDRHTGFWVRSLKPFAEDGQPADNWTHDGGWLPTKSVPIATLYYVQSLDADKKHFGLSKISQIAILTRKIIQLLSWTDEDVLANLAIFVFPGDQPKDAQGNPIETRLHPFSVIWVGRDAQVLPSVVQGDDDHINMKMKIIDAYIREILRLAFLIGASADAEIITSGIQGVVTRSELFMELRDLAGSLDRFSLTVFSLVKSWKADKDVSITELSDGTKVDFYKGNYAADPLETVIKNTAALRDAFSRVSPTMIKETYKQLVQSVLYNEDGTRNKVYAEIESYFNSQAANSEPEAAATEAAIETDLAGDAGTSLPENSEVS